MAGFLVLLFGSFRHLGAADGVLRRRAIAAVFCLVCAIGAVAAEDLLKPLIGRHGVAAAFFLLLVVYIVLAARVKMRAEERER